MNKLKVGDRVTYKCGKPKHTPWNNQIGIIVDININIVIRFDRLIMGQRRWPTCRDYIFHVGFKPIEKITKHEFPYT